MKVRAAAVTVLAATGLMFGAGLASATPSTPPPSQGDSLTVLLTTLLGLLGTGSSTGGGADSGIG
ncbi:hypothetical protein [Nocardia asteroides]|uniref:hypothetical protein n=1 Tax=Nocardia asteroides TaxID=1824 RepID=UPI001E563B18|nr:hypothetical protein [Nocardia asteroides]UGT59051.1 hypothetical protein LTT61_17275 [Nocardia asteroides]